MEVRIFQVCLTACAIPEGCGRGYAGETHVMHDRRLTIG